MPRSGTLSSPVNLPVTWEGAGVPHGSLGCTSHGRPCLSSPAGACPSELVKCLPGSVPPRATLTCNKTGKKDSCALTCASKARFLPGTGAGATTGTGRRVPISLHGPNWGGGEERLHSQGAEHPSSDQREGGRWFLGGGSTLGVDPWDGSLVQDPYSGVLGVIPPRRSHASLHRSSGASWGPGSCSGIP